MLDVGTYVRLMFVMVVRMVGSNNLKGWIISSGGDLCRGGCLRTAGGDELGVGGMWTS